MNNDVNPVQSTAPSTVKETYGRMEGKRKTYHDMGERMARLTIPTLLPPLDAGDDYKYHTPYQGIGARGVNTLASKLLLALFPATTSFFRLEVPEELTKELDKDALTEISQAFAKYEKQVGLFIEEYGMRIKLYEALKHLLVVGNVLLHLLPNNKLKLFTLSNYVVSRDSEGEVMLVITKEVVDYRTLTPDVRKVVASARTEGEELREVELYTEIRRLSPDSWEVRQEVEGIILDTARAYPGRYTNESLPYNVLTFIRPAGCDYGRGYVEEQSGDLWSLEGLMKSILEGTAALSKIIFLVRPGSLVDKRKLQEAENLAVLSGVEGDVTTVQGGKAADLAVAYQTINDLKASLSQAFLLNTSVQRDAERVSAEEIRLLAQELETALGGVRSILSQEMQSPLLKLILRRLSAAKRIPRLPKGITPVITTGVEALGRGQDFASLAQYLNTIQTLGGIEAAATFLNMRELHSRLLVSLGVSTVGLFKTTEEQSQEEDALRQQQEEEAMRQAAVRSAPNVANAMMNQQQPTQ